VLNENGCDCPNALREILAKLLEKGNTIGLSYISGFTTLFPPFKNHTSEHIRLSDKQIRLQIIPIFQSLIRRPYFDFFSKSFANAKKSQPNLEAIGLYTIGIATCVGIGVLFQGQTHNGVGLIHLSSDVVLNENGCDCPNALREILAKLLEKGNTIGLSIKVVQIYDIGDVDKTKLMIEQINQILDELKYTETRIVAMQTDQLAPSAQMAGNANLQLGPYNCMTT
jgi:hypothetical protein